MSNQHSSLGCLRWSCQKDRCDFIGLFSCHVNFRASDPAKAKQGQCYLFSLRLRSHPCPTLLSSTFHYSLQIHHSWLSRQLSSESKMLFIHEAEGEHIKLDPRKQRGRCFSWSSSSSKLDWLDKEIKFNLKIWIHLRLKSCSIILNEKDSDFKIQTKLIKAKIVNLIS